MSQTPETDDVLAKIAPMSLPDQIAQLSAHGHVLERQRQSLAQQLTDEKEDNTDTQKKWNEALDAGMKVVEQRDALRAEIESMTTALALETARLNWLAKSYDDLGNLTPEQEAASYGIYERVFNKARKQGLSNGEAVRLAVDAAIAG